MAPESKQIFKGLRFYYIPDTDMSQLRRTRITKAREHGATWVRDPHAATHIIADENPTPKEPDKDTEPDPEEHLERKSSLRDKLPKRDKPVLALNLYPHILIPLGNETLSSQGVFDLIVWEGGV
ncbi:hypothetical protein F4679DRAFT_589561 [Xylaria curta]|nr:hypothetical protein F4679DRAFT_589561 [Xylaria curta]